MENVVKLFQEHVIHIRRDIRKPVKNCKDKSEEK